MMVNNVISMLILAVIQGISEWLPVSSSGHLVLFSRILGFQNSVEFDAALHFGTLMAVFVYFGKDITNIIEAFLKGKWGSEDGKMAFLLIVATIPAAIIGYVFKKVFEDAFSSLGVVAFGFAITSVVLLISSLNFSKRKKDISYSKAFLIGCAQAVAIVPGISRSGSTISAGLLSGLDMKKALKFSFLMSIPIIFGANILELGNSTLPSSYILPTFLAMITGLLAIYLLFNFILTDKKNLRWFALYCFILAVGIGGYLMGW